jgi:spermidine/putrescine transport system substrate-binding protein
MPVAVLDAFTAETGIPVTSTLFTSAADAAARVRSGGGYDVVQVDNRLLPDLIAEGHLAPLNHANLPNLRNISPNFRNLIFDPRNHYSMPYSWGATGITVRPDEKLGPTMRWSDLWDKRYCGRMGVWRGQMRELIAATLKSLGYSANSEDPQELAAARQRLLALRPCVQVIDDYQPAQFVAVILQGKLVIGIAEPMEVLDMARLQVKMEYVAPADGPLLWGDSLVVPATSRRQDEAEQLINFLLRPEIGAALANANYFRTANAAAEPFLSSEFTADKALFPPIKLLENAEMMLPLSPEGKLRYAALEAAFLDAK